MGHASLHRSVSTLPSERYFNVGLSAFVIVPVERLADLSDMSLGHGKRHLAVHLYTEGHLTYFLCQRFQGSCQHLRRPRSLRILYWSEEQTTLVFKVVTLLQPLHLRPTVISFLLLERHPPHSILALCALACHHDVVPQSRVLSKGTC